MFFERFRKPGAKSITFDPQTQKPAIRASICTGEKVGGLLDLANGSFTEIQLLESDKDIEAFCRACGVESVETFY